MRHVLFSALLGLMFLSGARSAGAAEPIKALYLTGGGYHDYPKLAGVLTGGIAKHADVKWTVVTLDEKMEPLKDPKLGQGFDVLVYNFCYAQEKNPAIVENVKRVTREGKPTVLIHCAMHCFWFTDWHECCGLQTNKHDPYRSFSTKAVDPKHPIVQGWPADWTTPGDELYQNIELHSGSKPLLTAYSQTSQKDHVVAWVHTYGKGPVFATTLGHDMNTAGQDAYHRLLANGLLFVTGKLAVAAGEPAQGDWSSSVKFPAGEKPAPLFNGKDFDGWEGHTGKYWSIRDGVIVGQNTAENAPPVSTYLLTKKNYKDFRLVFEGKLAESEMHSGVAIWGKKFQPDKSQETHSYQGHLVMFPSGWGFYDLFRRNMIMPDDGRAKAAGKQHDWNRMEILAVGHRIRFVVNGKLVADWSDPKPELCQSGPIGLQLHSNKVSQRVEFRGLILAENPKDELATLEK